MSRARSWASHSTSNHRAYGEAGPVRSTDHSAAFSDAGVGTAMWFGTTSTTIPRPSSRARSESRWNSSAPPRSSLNREWSTTSYPCVEPGVACRTGER